MATARVNEVDRQPRDEDYHFLYNPFRKAIVINEFDLPDTSLKLFFKTPWFAPLLFPNQSSDARDHAANERTFLSWLRLSIYLAVVSVAIFINFHLKHEPTPLEQSISKPLGVIFWILALCCLASGFGIYIRTISKYARRRALVQTGLKTQVIFGVIASAIIAACGVFLGAEAQSKNINDNQQVMGSDQAKIGSNQQHSEALRTLLEQVVQVAGGVGSYDENG